MADQCAELRAHIAQLDQLIAQDTIRDSRNLRIQDRNNWVRAYNEICTGSSARGSGGGGYSGGANRWQQGLGALQGILGTLSEWARESEARRQAELQEAERQLRLWEQQRAIEEARREAEELEKKRRALAEKAADDKKRRAMTNPWATGGGSIGGATANPFASTVSSSSGAAANPFGGAAALAQKPGRTGITPVPSRSFRTDEEIKAFCARSSNPSMCELAEQDARSRSPEYQKWRREQAVLQDRAIEAAQDDIDRAIAEYRRQKAGGEGTPGSAGARPATAPSSSPHFIPAAPFAQAPVDRSGDGYDKCREGAVRPDTVVGCYEQPIGGTARPTPATAQQTADADRRTESGRKKALEAAARRDVLRAWVAMNMAARNGVPLSAQLPAVEDAVAKLPPGPHRERMSALVARLKIAVGRANTNRPMTARPPAPQTASAPNAEATPPGDSGNDPNKTRPATSEVKVSPWIEEWRQNRPAPGNYPGMSAEQCRYWRGYPSSFGGCEIAEKLYEGPQALALAGSESDAEVQRLVAEMEKELFATPEDPTGQWMGRPVPAGAQPEK